VKLKRFGMLVDRISVHLFDLGPLPTVWFAVQGPIYVAAKRATASGTQLMQCLTGHTWGSGDLLV